MLDIDFFKGKKILLTGHTGFKGAWMSRLLYLAGANVVGYSLGFPSSPSLFELCRLDKGMKSITGDIRDLQKLQNIFNVENPEIVIHMAAQPIVRESYKDPVYTYEVNVMGTVNILECVRKSSSVKSFLNVTTDKVYLNKEWEWGYREYEELNGFDPYSNSKSCSELVTDSYKNSFFSKRHIAISTARAGNVIGGGDFAHDRILPDCIRAIQNGTDIIIRNPYSIRPYEHVLDPIVAYLMIVKAQYEAITYADKYNVGPDENDCWTTGELVTLFCKEWNKLTGKNLSWKNICTEGPHEANILKLDCSKIKKTLGWRPRWNVETAIEKIVEWNSEYLFNGNILACMDRQISDFIYNTPSLMN